MIGYRHTTARKWCEGKVRPIQGNAPHDLAGKPGESLVKEHLRRSLRHHCVGQFQMRHLTCVFQAWRNLSGPMGFSKPTSKPNPGSGPTTSRWSAPSPGKRTRREDHVLSHRPQMSSDRLFLDRVARQHCPSPLHRRSQNITGSQQFQAKGDISTLPARGHFYFALTNSRCHLQKKSSRRIIARKRHRSKIPEL